jgi:hypothetical protein
MHLHCKIQSVNPDRGNNHILMSSIFWDITPCSVLKVNRRFGGICHLSLQFLRNVR